MSCSDCTPARPSARDAAVEVISRLVFIDALGQARCGVTGVLTTKCTCADDLAYGHFPPAGYRGQPEWDEAYEVLLIPSGQAPRALTRGEQV